MDRDDRGGIKSIACWSSGPISRRVIRRGVPVSTVNKVEFWVIDHLTPYCPAAPEFWVSGRVPRPRCRDQRSRRISLPDLWDSEKSPRQVTGLQIESRDIASHSTF